MADAFLGIDVGTASTKGVLVDSNGRILGTAARPHTLSLPKPGWAEHDAEDVWWNDFVDICRELLESNQGRVSAVGVSGIGPCLLAADSAGRPLRPAILYGIDTRAESEVEQQRQRLGGTRVLERCGSPITSQAIGPKIEWVRNHEPEVFEATDRFFMASSYLINKLTGAYVLDHHSASQSVPMYDISAGRWADDWCEDIAPGISLPELVWPSDIVGHVTQLASEMTGLPVGTPVAGGTIDAWAEAHSVGVNAPGEMMIMYGSTMFLVQIVDDIQGSQSLWGTAGIYPGTYSVAGGMATSGSLTEWLRRLTGAGDFDILTREAAAIRPGSEGLIMLPYFAGERTPIFDPEARGVIVGLTLRHQRGHLYRSALEATAFGVRHNLEAMSDVGATPTQLVAVGGGTRGSLWSQIVSDVLQESQDLPTVTIGASFGDAMLAAASVGHEVDVQIWNPHMEKVRPNRQNRERYDALYRIYRELYPATRQVTRALAGMQRTQSR